MCVHHSEQLSFHVLLSVWVYKYLTIDMAYSKRPIRLHPTGGTLRTRSTYQQAEPAWCCEPAVEVAIPDLPSATEAGETSGQTPWGAWLLQTRRYPGGER